MKNKRVYFLVFFLVIIGYGYGQQDPQFSQHMYTILPINPGIAGSGGICASLHYRQQWAGFHDTDTNGTIYKTAPRDIMLTLHTPVKFLHGGVGLTVYNDSYGQQTDIIVKLAYSFRMNIGSGVLGIGPSFDLLSRKMHTDRWYYNPEHIDQVLVNQIGESDMYFDISFGAYYQMQDKWYAGVSATQLIASIGGDKVSQKGARHLYFLGGYSFELPSNPNWTFRPCALVKTDLKTVQVDATFIADWNEMFWFGASYRIIDAVAIIGGARPFINYSSPIRGLEAVVSYDINTSKLMRYGRSFGGYEFCIKYCFKIVTKSTTEAYRGTRLLGNRPIDYR